MDEKNGGDQDQVQSERLEFQIPYILSRVTFLISQSFFPGFHGIDNGFCFCFLCPLRADVSGWYNETTLGYLAYSLLLPPLEPDPEHRLSPALSEYSIFSLLSSMARLILALLFVIAPGVMAKESGSCTAMEGYAIPDLMSTFGAYPNPLDLTEQDREGFHPVVIFPPNEDIPVLDLRQNSDGIASEEERIKSKKEKSLWKQLLREILNISRRLRKKSLIQPRGKWAVGKYDENRVGLYSTEMFEDTENSIDGFAGQRTLHLGVDLMTNAGAKVYAFCDGVVHSAGYNPELGDYGNVVVIQHNIPAAGAKPRTVWALYGHMDAGTIRGKKTGTRILKGQVIGRVGDIHGELL